MALEKINKPNDIKLLDESEYSLLATEIRNFLIEKISKTGGHLASNLGVVELTMALHLVFNLPEDKIVWDVGHQSYTHKLLTGRKNNFDELRKYGGISGFPKRKESDFDAFDTGHSSTSISAGLGLAYARDIKNENNFVISVIGDGSLTGGMAYEALNNASQIRSNFIIVLNDNDMSISENVGGVSNYLGRVRTAITYNDFKLQLQDILTKIPNVGDKIVDRLKRTKSSIKQLFIPGMFFEDMGITYLGPIDGHDINQLVRTFKEARKVKHAVLVHVVTKKGKGYEPAERNPSIFHGVEPFNVNSGLPKRTEKIVTYTDIFSKTICKLANDNKDIVAITAAMPDGTGLKRFSRKYPKRFFDVGIAEEHAVTFAAGLAAAGLKPFVAVYSSFLQRAYDQVLHDVCIQQLPVVFAIDRAGLVGSDGETHQGIFDMSFLSTIPNMTIFAPKNRYELVKALRYGADFDMPIAIRYPRGEAYAGLKEYNMPIEYGKSETIIWESDIALLAVGSMVEVAMQVHCELQKQNIKSTVINMRFVKPIDSYIIDRVAGSHRLIVTMEENVINGGFGEKVIDYMESKQYKNRLIPIAIPDEYVEHGNVNILKKEVGIDKDSIISRIYKAI